MVFWARDLESGPELIACSYDGVNWSLGPEYCWCSLSRNGSDSSNDIFYNPFTKLWCIICRKRNCARRVAMADSVNFKHWTEPRLILHPDVMDPPLLQFYGMPVVSYEKEYFIGIVQCLHFRAEEFKSRGKMDGAVDGQLVYSYDG